MDARALQLSEEYVAQRSQTSLAAFEADFDTILRVIERFRPVTASTQFFEIGAGLGWFEVIAAKRGLSCAAVEVNPVFRDAALDLAMEQGVQVNISLGSVESFDLPRERYDAVIATSVFEHVPHYGRGFAKIYESLRSGGVLYFYSTNKFSLRSGEFTELPLYSWYPYSIRRRIRVWRQGPEIVRSAGIDFNQFTYWGLKRHLKSLGFSHVVDRFDYLPVHPLSPVKTALLRILQAVPPAGALARLLDTSTTIVCVK